MLRACPTWAEGGELGYNCFLDMNEWHLTQQPQVLWMGDNMPMQTTADMWHRAGAKMKCVVALIHTTGTLCKEVTPSILSSMRDCWARGTRDAEFRTL